MMRLNDDDYDDDYDEEFSDDYNDDYSDDYDDSYDEGGSAGGAQKEENFFPQPYKGSQGTGTGSCKRIFQFCTVLFIILGADSMGAATRTSSRSKIVPMKQPGVRGSGMEVSLSKSRQLLRTAVKFAMSCSQERRPS